jgi:hypothetical protein
MYAPTPWPSFPAAPATPKCALFYETRKQEITVYLPYTLPITASCEIDGGIGQLHGCTTDRKRRNAERRRIALATVVESLGYV